VRACAYICVRDEGQSLHSVRFNNTPFDSRLGRLNCNPGRSKCQRLEEWNRSASANQNTSEHRRKVDKQSAEPHFCSEPDYSVGVANSPANYGDAMAFDGNSSSRQRPSL
jgi:hypothetical protein